jgi:hypothetical protein
MPDRIDWQKIALAALTLATTALGGNAIYSTNERGEIDSKAQKAAERAEVSCEDIDRLRDDVREFLSVIEDVPEGTIERGNLIFRRPACGRR